MQEGLHEPQPQAIPYAAAVADPELADNSEPVDQGIEYGLATAAATDQADVAYTQQEQPAGSAADAESDSNGEEPAGASVATESITNTAAHTSDDQVAEEVC